MKEIGTTIFGSKGKKSEVGTRGVEIHPGKKFLASELQDAIKRILWETRLPDIGDFPEALCITHAFTKVTGGLGELAELEEIIVGETNVISVVPGSNTCWAKMKGKAGRHVPIVDKSKEETNLVTVIIVKNDLPNARTPYLLIDAYYGGHAPHLPEDPKADLKVSLDFWNSHAFAVAGEEDNKYFFIDLKTKTEKNPYFELQPK